MGQNGAVIGQIPHFGPFPFEKICIRGAKKGGKPSSTKSGFQHLKRFLVIKEVLLLCFEVKRGPGWGVVAQNVNSQCQNLNGDSAQTTGGAHLAPNFGNHLVMLFDYGLHQKRNIPGPLLS